MKPAPAEAAAAHPENRYPPTAEPATPTMHGGGQ
jgi:hypothetical protein